MRTMGEILAQTDIIRYLLAIIIVTLTVMIIWVLMRELRLWYWKSNATRGSLKNIEKRMQKLESNLKEISLNVESISENTEVFKHMSVSVREADEDEEE